MKKIPFTKEGYEALLEEQKNVTLQRKEAVLDLKKAREMGDLSENGYYKAAKFKLGAIDRRLRELVYQIRFGVIEEPKTDAVSVGSTVTIVSEKAEKTYMIVGKYEANPSDGKISSESPFGKLLIGKKEGESILHVLPGKTQKYRIKSVVY